MPKVYTIFVFLLSGIVQLSQTSQSIPKIYGNVFTFEDGKLLGISELSEDANESVSTQILKVTLATKTAPYKADPDNIRQQAVFNIDITKNGICYFSHLNLFFAKSKPRLPLINIHGFGVCPANQTMIRWSIEQEGMYSYDFVFIRDISVRIAEKDLSKIVPDAVYAYKGVVEKISALVEQLKIPQN